MARKLVIGNWKMHGSMQQVDALLHQLLDSPLASPPHGGAKAPAGIGAEVAVCPPAVYLERAVRQLQDSPIGVGAQDVSAHQQGAYTGDICATMLADIGCRYVIIGHSERRQYHAENEASVAAKLERALAAGLTPVVCVGETLAQRERGETLAVITAQLQPVLAVGSSRLASLVVAYEPVWAIGSGQSATPAQAQEVHAHLRRTLAASDRDAARSVPLLYGGSVKPDNAADLLSQPNIDGALVGGASLKAEDFLAIVSAAATTSAEPG